MGFQGPVSKGFQSGGLHLITFHNSPIYCQDLLIVIILFYFKVLLSEMDAVASVTAMDLRRSEEKEGLPVEVFSKVQEMFSNMDWLDANTDATKTSVDNMGMIFQEKAENHAMPREQTSLPLPLKHEGQQLPPMPPPQPPPPPSTPPPQRRQSSSTHGDCITFPLRSRTSPLPSEVTSSLPPTLQPVSIGVAPPCPPPPPPIRSQRASPKIAPSTPPPPPPPSRTSSIYSSKSNSKENKGKDNDIVLQSLNAGAVSTTKPIGVMGRGLRRSISPKNSQFTNSSSRKILKPLHWVKVSRAMKGSLWAEPHRPDEAFKYFTLHSQLDIMFMVLVSHTYNFPCARSLEIDMSELENLFSAAVPSAKEKSSRRSSVGSRTEKVHLVITPSMHVHHSYSIWTHFYMEVKEFDTLSYI